MIIRDCALDEARLEPLKESMQVDRPIENETDPDWPFNFLARRTVAYSCGKLARAGDAVRHEHESDELDLCRRLSADAAAIMAGTYLCMSDESDHEFAPFYIAANVGDPVPATLTEPVLRTAFGGTIYPGSAIRIEPLQEAGVWWKAASGQPTADGNTAALDAWRKMIAWFNGRPELHGACFVRFEEGGEGDPIGFVFPQMALAITARGSLVGLFGCVVWT